MTDTTIPVPPDVAAMARVLGDDPATWRHNCHRASIAIVKSGILPGARVARGAALGVMGQHSWVVVGDPYGEDSSILDPTLWSYDSNVEGIWTGDNLDRHFPHGHGNIWEVGGPPPMASVTGEDPVALTPKTPLSPGAENFVELLGPLGIRGWMTLANGPMQGWPASEIIEAMLDTPGLGVLVPIDVAGMITDRNPSGLYLPGEEQE